MRVWLVFLFLCTPALPVGAQAFSDASRSLVKYDVAATAPNQPCPNLSAFAGYGIVSITTRVVAATAATPQHCRVTGLITPELAFEINLPDRWNRRFYMVGNGGLAGDALDTVANADRTGALTAGFVIARTNTGHDSRKEPSGRSSSAILKKRSTTRIALRLGRPDSPTADGRQLLRGHGREEWQEDA
jgi:hypothetical protein